MTLDDEEIKKDSQIISRIKHFISKYNWEGINYPSKKSKRWLEKIWETIVLNDLYVKKRKFILPTFPKKTWSVKNKLLF